jgi:hypothetical protein
VPSSDAPKTPLHPRAYGIVMDQGKTGHLSNVLPMFWRKLDYERKRPTARHHKEGAVSERIVSKD